MKRILTIALVVVLSTVAVAQMSSPTVTEGIRFSGPPTSVYMTITSDGRVLFPDDAAAVQTQQITVAVSQAQIAALRVRWPEPTQIGLPAGTPATAQQLIQAYINYGLSGDVERLQTERRTEKLKGLSAADCQRVADTLKVAVTDLPCGGQ